MNTMTIIPHVEALIAKIWEKNNVKVLTLPTVKFNREGQTTWLSKRDFGPHWLEFVTELANMVEPTTLKLNVNPKSCKLSNEVVKKSFIDMSPSEQQTWFNNWYRDASCWQAKEVLQRVAGTARIYVDTDARTITIREDEEYLKNVANWLKEDDQDCFEHYILNLLITSMRIEEVDTSEDQWFTREKTTNYTDEYVPKQIVLEIHPKAILGKAKAEVFSLNGNEQVTIRLSFPRSFKNLSSNLQYVQQQKQAWKTFKWKLLQEKTYIEAYIKTRNFEIEEFDELAELGNPECLIPEAWFSGKESQEMEGIPMDIFR